MLTAARLRYQYRNSEVNEQANTPYKRQTERERERASARSAFAVTPMLCFPHCFSTLCHAYCRFVCRVSRVLCVYCWLLASSAAAVDAVAVLLSVYAVDVYSLCTLSSLCSCVRCERSVYILCQLLVCWAACVVCWVSVWLYYMTKLSAATSRQWQCKAKSKSKVKANAKCERSKSSEEMKRGQSTVPHAR